MSARISSAAARDMSHGTRFDVDKTSTDKGTIQAITYLAQAIILFLIIDSKQGELIFNR